MGDRYGDQLHVPDPEIVETLLKKQPTKKPDASHDSVTRPDQAHQADALRLSQPLSFDGVVGHTTIAQFVEIENITNRATGIATELAGNGKASPFVVDGVNGYLLQTAQRGDKLRIPVRFAPSVAGQVSATLVVKHDHGEQRVTLNGNALDAKGHEPPAGKGDSPTTVEPIPAKEPTVSKPALKSNLLDAAARVARLGDRYNAIAPQSDAATGQFAQQIVTAGTQLNAKITTWLRDEGIESVEDFTSKSSSVAGDVIKMVVIKTLETLGHAVTHHGNIAMEIGLAVVDLAWSAVMVSGENKEKAEFGQEYKERVNTIAELGTAASTEATREMFKIYGALMGSYAAAGGALAEAAGDSSQKILRAINLALADIDHGEHLGAQHVYDDARVLIDKYQVIEKRWAAAASQVATFGLSAASKTEGAFSRTLDVYADTLARESAKKHGDESETAPIEIDASGDLDFESKTKISITGLKFGDAGRLSSTLFAHVAAKSLKELVHYNVTIRLRDPARGELMLRQNWAGGDNSTREQEMPEQLAGWVNAHGGIERVWSILDAGSIGARSMRG